MNYILQFNLFNVSLHAKFLIKYSDGYDTGVSSSEFL